MMRQGWQKSSFSGGGDGAECVEVSAGDRRRLRLRESEAPLRVFDASPAALAGLIRHVKGGGAVRPT
jgi:uncharacterized protein DUF397